MNAHAYPEPTNVYPEELFDRALTELLRGLLDCDSSLIIPRFGLDLAIFMKGSRGPRIVFVETKSYGGQRQGGVGFGNGLGVGPQVDILLASAAQCSILDKQVCWAFADATLPVATARYALLTCSAARNAAMGTVGRGKQNNLRLSALKAHNVTWSVFCERLLSFVSNEETT